MATEQLFRLSGISLVAGGLLATAGWLLFLPLDPVHRDYESNLWLPLNFLIIGGGFFMLLGLPGFYASQARESGMTGLLGFFFFFAGLSFAYIAVHSLQTMTMPDVPAGMRLLASFAAPSLFIGVLLTAIAIWRAGVYEPWLAVAFAVSVLLGLLTRLAPMPAWLGRNVIPAIFTLTMLLAGLSLFSQFGPESGGVAQMLRQ